MLSRAMLQGEAMAAPDVSFVMAAFNAAPFIEDAIRSVLAQADVTSEIIVVDDHSQDDTRAFVENLSAEFRNIVALHNTGKLRGPSAARNIGLAAAKGRWIAIVDADDLILPQRTSRLVSLGEAERADMVADNILRFEDADPAIAWPMLEPRGQGSPRMIGLDTWLTGNHMLGGETNLGYLKPMFRAGFIRRHGLEYDTRLDIGEDYLMVLTALVMGARFVLTTEPMYEYRMQQGSLSRRLDAAGLARLAEAENGVMRPLAGDAGMRRILADHQDSIGLAIGYEQLKACIAARDWRGALSIVKTRPRVAGAVARVASNRWRRGRRLAQGRTVSRDRRRAMAGQS